MRGSPNSTEVASDRIGYRGRLRWWAILAVTLALMALVAAVSFSTGIPSGRSASLGAHLPPTTPPPSKSLPASTTTPDQGSTPSVPQSTTTPIGRSTQTPLSPTIFDHPPTETSSDTGAGTAGPSTDSAPPTSASPTDSVVPAPPAVTTTTAPTVHTYSGNLEYPDNVSASYQVAGGGKVTATANWTGAATLSLAVACPSGTSSTSGVSGISVSFTDAPGDNSPCSVTLAEPLSEESVVSYSLAIQYLSG